MSNTTNIFEWASRNHPLFETSSFPVSTGDLWALPLRNEGNEGVPGNLNDIARRLNKKLKQCEEENFVSDSPKKDPTTQIKFDIVKHIITVRLDEAKQASEAASRKAEKEELMRLLKDAEDKEKQQLTKEELLAKLAELS